MGIEVEIDIVAEQANKSVWWKDVFFLYEKINRQPYDDILFGIRPTHEKDLIFKEWSKVYNATSKNPNFPYNQLNFLEK